MFNVQDLVFAKQRCKKIAYDLLLKAFTIAFEKACFLYSFLKKGTLKVQPQGYSFVIIDLE